jgi:AraC-like DNA-binding protein
MSAWRLIGNRIGRQGIHNHDEVEILYVLSGKIQVEVDFENFEFDVGNFLVINQGDYHSIQAIGEEAQTLSIYFSALDYLDDFPLIDRAIFVCESFSYETGWGREYDELRKTIVEFVVALEDDKIQLMKSIVKALTTKFTIINYIQTVNQKQIQLKQNDLYYKILDTIENDYQDADYLNDPKKREYYSKPYITRLLKQYINYTIRDFVNYKRCRSSQNLLLTTDMTISEISHENGFSDPKYYYKYFRKWYHCTPAEYRNKNRPNLNCMEDVSYLDYDCLYNLIKEQYPVETLLVRIKITGKSKDEISSILDRVGNALEEEMVKNWDVV